MLKSEKRQFLAVDGKQDESKTEELNIGSTRNIDVEKVIGHSTPVVYDEWISVRRKGKKKNQHPRFSDFRNSTIKFSGADRNVTEGINTVNVIRESSIDKSKEKSGILDSEVEDQYLKKGAKPKSSAAFVMQGISYAEKVSVSSSKLDESEKSYVINRDNSVVSIMSGDVVREEEKKVGNNNLEDQCLEKSLSEKLVVSDSIGELYHEYLNSRYKTHDDFLYRKTVIEFCHQLKDFKRLHVSYCIRIMKQVFEIKNRQLVISDDVIKFLSKFTQNTDLLLFVIKVFLLVNLTNLYGGKEMTNNMRYCAAHFRDHSLFDPIILDLMKIFKKEKGILGVIEAFICHRTRLCNVCDISNCKPHSGEFFREIFNIYCNFALVEVHGEYEELVDFIMLGCLVYCGHMVGMLCKVLIYDCKKEGMTNLIHKNLNMPSFSQKCYDLKKAMVHMYHPSRKNEVPRNIAGKINIPIAISRSCTRRIGNIVEHCIDEGRLDFGIFVKDMIFAAKKLISKPNTRRFYVNNIEMYDTKIEAVSSLSKVSVKLCKERFKYFRSLP